MKLNLTHFFVIVIAVFIISSKGWCAPSAQDEIRIGFIGPLTGEANSFGTDAKNSIEIAVKEINDSQYLPGKKLIVLYEDGKCNGKDASIAAQKLVNIDKVKVILGGVCSSETLAAAAVTEPKHVILLSAFSTNPDISNAGDYVFRLSPSDVAGGELAAKSIAESGFAKIGIISESTEYSLGVRKIFIDQIEKRGSLIVADETYNPDANDFRSLLLKIKAKSPDALFLNPNAGIKAGLLVRQLKELNWRIPLYGTYAFSSEEASKAAGGIGALEGIKFVDAPIVNSDKGRSFLKSYADRFGKPQSEFQVAFTYDTVYIVVDALRQVGLDSSKIRDHFYSLSVIHGVSADYRFDRNGDVVGVPYVLKEIKNGTIELVTDKNT